MTDLGKDGHQGGVLAVIEPSSANRELGAACCGEKEVSSNLRSTPQFPAIYEEYFDFVWRGVRRFGVHTRSLEDATQDVFLVVHRRLGDFESRSSLKTWLYGIIRRVAKDYRRRVSRKEAGMIPTEDVQLATGQAPPDELAARHEAAQTLETILSSIDESRRAIFVLAEVESMTVPEISEVLSLNLNTTYSRLRTARAEFEKAVARHLATMETQS